MADASNEWSNNEASNEVSNEAGETVVDLENLPRVLVRPQSDDDGQLLNWQAVKKLRISHIGPENPIHLRQIEVYGCDGTNYALKSNGGSAHQSSTMGDGEYWGPAEFVIDGDRESRVNHTAHEPNGWLEITLAKAVEVESFVLVNMSDDEHDHRMRLQGHLVELVDEHGRVVYQHTLEPGSDPHLFDVHAECRQRFVNEEANNVFATLVMQESDEVPGMTKVTAVKMSGEIMAEVTLGMEAEGAASFLCEQISEKTRAPAYRLRLMLPDGQILRSDEGGQDTLLSWVPNLEEEMKKNASRPPTKPDLFECKACKDAFPSAF
eukprot:s475_g1.t1